MYSTELYRLITDLRSQLDTLQAKLAGEGSAVHGGTHDPPSPKPGYYAWVCYVNIGDGQWFGPVQQSEIDKYEEGFALDNNIKSWTEFLYYSDKPGYDLTCSFDKRIRLTHVRGSGGNDEGEKDQMEKSKQLKVYARDGWQNTSITLNHLQVANIVASGAWKTHTNPIGPDGYVGCAADSDYYLPGAWEGSLIAMVSDGNNANKAFIGSNGHIQALFPGILYLSANDERGDAERGNGFYDNDGFLSVDISV